MKDTKGTRALRTPYWDIDANFVKQSVADDLVNERNFSKKIRAGRAHRKVCCQGNSDRNP